MQFIIDLIWNLNEKTGDSDENNKMEIDNELFKSQESVDLKLKAISSLIKLVDEINLFNPVDDQNNNNLFKDWLKEFITKTFKCKFKLNFCFFLKIRFPIFLQKYSFYLK